MTAGFSIPDGEFRQIYTYGDFNAVPIVSGSIYGAILIPCRSMAETQGVFSLGDKRFIWKIPSGTEFRSGWRHPWTITLNDSEAPGESGIAIGEISINDWNGAGNAPIEGATREP